MFVGEEQEGQKPETCFIVYPGLVRIEQDCDGCTIEEAVAENARLRLKLTPEDKWLENQPRNYLTPAAAKAVLQLADNPLTRATAWFETAGELDSETGDSKREGTTVWVLLRSAIADVKTSVRSEVEPEMRWLQADGRIVSHFPESGKAFQVL
jgi:hypothetical protein